MGSFRASATSTPLSALPHNSPHPIPSPEKKKIHKKEENHTVSPKCLDTLPPNGWNPPDRLGGGCDAPLADDEGGEDFLNGIFLRSDDDDESSKRRR
jgi:hypothetical protein